LIEKLFMDSSVKLKNVWLHTCEPKIGVIKFTGNDPMTNGNGGINILVGAQYFVSLPIWYMLFIVQMNALRPGIVAESSTWR
jgi:hypothetical protein